MAVRGVRRSCDTESRKSRWRPSECRSAPARVLIASLTATTSVGPTAGSVTARLPAAGEGAAAAGRRSGGGRPPAAREPEAGRKAGGDPGARDEPAQRFLVLRHGVGPLLHDDDAAPADRPSLDEHRATADVAGRGYVPSGEHGA